jgi:hypothetical protein
MHTHPGMWYTLLLGERYGGAWEVKENTIKKLNPKCRVIKY